MKPSASSLLLYSLLIQHLQYTFTRQIPFVAVTSRHSAEAPRSGENYVTNYPQDLNYHSKRNEKIESRSNRKRCNHKDARILESSIHVYKGHGRSSRYPTDEDYSALSTSSKKEPLPIHIEEQCYKRSPAELGRHEQSSGELSSQISSSNRLLRIPMSLSLQHESQAYDAVPIKTFIDTGAQTTVMTFDAAKRAGIAHLIDRRYVGHASGVAGVSCRVLGRIPANSVSFIIGDDDDIIDTSPSIAILEDRILDGEAVDMLLGLDVLEEWQAMICLRDRVLTVRNGRRKLQGKDIIIPFQSSTKKSCGGLPKVNYRTKSNCADLISRESSNRQGKKKQKKQTSSSNYNPSVKPKDSLYSQRSNIFSRDSSLLKSELDALDERSKSRPVLNDSTYQKNNRISQYQGMEDDFVGEEDDDSDSYYSESDEDYDDCDLSGV